jgi:hypothetical protein
MLTALGRHFQQDVDRAERYLREGALASAYADLTAVQASHSPLKPKLARALCLSGFAISRRGSAAAALRLQPRVAGALPVLA